MEEQVAEPVSRIVAVVGGERRRDQWLLAPETQVVSVLGATSLDLRQSGSPESGNPDIRPETPT